MLSEDMWWLNGNRKYWGLSTALEMTGMAEEKKSGDYARSRRSEKEESGPDEVVKG